MPDIGPKPLIIEELRVPPRPAKQLETDQILGAFSRFWSTVAVSAAPSESVPGEAAMCAASRGHLEHGAGGEGKESAKRASLGGEREGTTYATLHIFDPVSASIFKYRKIAYLSPCA